MVMSFSDMRNVFLLLMSDCWLIQSAEYSIADLLQQALTSSPHTVAYDGDSSTWNLLDFRLLVPNVSQELWLLPEMEGQTRLLDPSVDELELDYYNNSSGGHNCSNAYNSSCVRPPTAPTFQASALTRVVVLLLIAILSLVGNVATLASILGRRQGRTSTVYMLLVQLAVADLLVGAFCILADALWTLSVQWYGGNVLCKGVKFMQLFSLYLSTFLLVLIGFDRLCAVRFPMRRARARHHVRTGIVCVWALSALLSFPQVFIFSVMRGPFLEEFHQCVTYAFYTAQWQEQLYTTLTLLTMFLLPLTLLLATYTATFLAIARREKTFRRQRERSIYDSARQKILRRAKLKSLAITVVIVLAFVVCWTPYYVTMLIFMFLEPSEQLSRELQSAVFFFGSSTAAINPLIYGAFHLRPCRLRRRREGPRCQRCSSKSNSTRLETCSHLTTFRSQRSRRKARVEIMELRPPTSPYNLGQQTTAAKYTSGF